MFQILVACWWTNLPWDARRGPDAKEWPRAPGEQETDFRPCPMRLCQGFNMYYMRPTEQTSSCREITEPSPATTRPADIQEEVRSPSTRRRAKPVAIRKSTGDRWPVTCERGTPLLKSGATAEPLFSGGQLRAPSAARTPSESTKEPTGLTQLEAAHMRPRTHAHTHSAVDYSRLQSTRVN